MSVSEPRDGGDPAPDDVDAAGDQDPPSQEPAAHPTGERQAEENRQNESPG